MADVELEEHLKTICPRNRAKPDIVFFDFDKTLIAGYSILAMARERVRHGLSRGQVRQSLSIMRSLVDQKDDRQSENRGGSYKQLVQILTKTLKGVPEEVLIELGEQAYRNTIASSVYREAITLVETHRKAGHHLVIVSAASRYQIAPVARALGIEDICCTSLEVIDGKFSGRTLAPLCYGEGKTLAARRICKREKTRLSDCWFYSDSADDLPLLKQVGHPVSVNPSDSLRAYATTENWPLLTFESRGFPTIETFIRTLMTAQTVATATALCSLSRRFRIGSKNDANRITRLVGEVGSGFAGIDLEIEGSEHLNSRQPAVYIFNHQSLLDALVIARLLRGDVVGLCKKEMANNPLLGPLLRHIDTIFVDREERDQSDVLKRAMTVISSGRSLVIAPEGTRSTLGDIQPFKHGAFYLARKAGVPVVPIVLHNVKDVLPKGGLMIRPTTVRVTVLPPMHPESLGGIRQSCEKMELAYSEVLASSSIAALPYSAIARAS